MGKRLYPYSKNTPKPLVRINKKPFIYYLIKQLEKFNFKEIIIIAGYKSNKFDDFIKKYLTKFNLNIKIIKQPTKWKTAKRINSIKSQLDNIFCLLYGDNLVNIKSIYFKKKINKVLVQSSKIALEKGNISINGKLIKEYIEKRNKNLSYVELGYFILDKKTILENLNSKNENFSKVIFRIVKKKKLYYYITKSKYLSITNPSKLKITKENIKKYFSEYRK